LPVLLNEQSQPKEAEKQQSCQEQFPKEKQLLGKNLFPKGSHQGFVGHESQKIIKPANYFIERTVKFLLVSGSPNSKTKVKMQLSYIRCPLTFLTLFLQ
jgi:hypothetical protein